MSEYTSSLDSQTFEQWLNEVTSELSELGHIKKLTANERDWLHNTWDNYDLSPAEAAQSFINETPAY